ncbi:DUF2997 domain-containing protein [Galactobacter valiniphilus]|uniref:DUF2997 domain-containing protein n=1 Tax=Galactobacter valiniphilus TaxID=2676122 RepID=A0A399JDW6_9MICC|nr:DUF2997 domain-containing protein [Galactobacter valiniphilus]RII42242.1 DUF2997 domain-containing protein [Galactobacter valiniphilus]
MTRRLSVSIRPDGTIAAEASGTPGPDCLEALEQLKALLHAEVEASKPTPEFALLPETVQDEAAARQRLEGQA